MDMRLVMGLGINRLRKINDEYRIYERIARGGHCEIYRVKDSNGVHRAAKFVSIQHKYILENDVKAMYEFDGSRQHGNVYWYYHGTHGNNYVIVLDLLGESLKELMEKLGTFKLATVLKLVIKMTSVVQALHERGLIHRDIKPANFVIGKHGLARKHVHLIGYTFATEYTDERGHHIPVDRQYNFHASSIFESRSAHRDERESRKSDLESLAYLIIYLIKGLPWESLRESHSLLIGPMKEDFKSEDLCAGLLEEVGMYYSEVTTLRYEQTPDYSKLRRFLEAAVEKIEFVPTDSFEWILEG